MSLCPVCGCWLCDHTARQRGQTREEIFRLMTPEEIEAWESGNQLLKMRVARKNAHLVLQQEGTTEHSVSLAQRQQQG